MFFTQSWEAPSPKLREMCRYIKATADGPLLCAQFPENYVSDVAKFQSQLWISRIKTKYMFKGVIKKNNRHLSHLRKLI